MRRAGALLPVFALAACGQGTGSAPEPPMVTIECATDGAGAFKRDCRVEPVVEGTRHLLIVHHPGGGFRRLLKVDDGRGVVAADGVVPAQVAWLADGRLEVTVGGDRYRFPAKVKADGPKTP
ncbi:MULTISPECIES: hypothetical protein [unclassified Novosphingobium]|uniref:hypothetical protein n=1 Tax=unclassified Novosphingobium TaxID=2644732 RepID=UPI0014463ACD|nr:MULTISPECIES: hypothetical protein [unclassified Novosphingobium]NKJ41811.1 hypothetical protein [Novosphingobium sp. SG720]NMN04197.1 hypothetical protein [Novosphingobium sp. SG919]NMN85811.1 hypothetical protein [Novosphingobium sp. SG916]